MKQRAHRETSQTKETLIKDDTMTSTFKMKQKRRDRSDNDALLEALMYQVMYESNYPVGGIIQYPRDSCSKTV